MNALPVQPIPRLDSLPKALPLEGAVRIDLVEGMPVFRASNSVQNRIEDMLVKQKTSKLSTVEESELDTYAEMDDFLSFVNRTVRNLILVQSESAEHGVPAQNFG